MNNLLTLLEKYIPTDHCRQVSSYYYSELLFNKKESIKNVLDLGCGSGNSRDYFTSKNPNIQWIGLDIEKNQDISSRKEKNIHFQVYDGVHIPFEENSFDLIYCNQVLEHVQYPFELLKNIYRVLKVNGYFIGSTSNLEPYHSHSIWNFTPYGFSFMMKSAGLQLIEIRPSIDAITLIIRRGLKSPPFFSHWWNYESPLNHIINIIGKITRKKPSWINCVKLLFCGQFCFLVRKNKNH